jgi:pentapeptide MXKDX repeat protein
MPQHVTTTHLLAVALGLALMPMQAFAQQDTAMVHDSTMMSKDEMSKDGMSKDEMSKDGMSKDEMSKDGMSKDGMSKDGMSKDGMSKDEMSKDGMSKDGMSKDAMGKDAMANMMFVGGAGEKATGDYAIVEAGGKRRVELTESFSVADAPDLHLILANGATPGDGAVDIGKLKRESGAQTFNLPGGKDLDGYSTLLVWSKKERRTVATAEWHPSGGGMMMDHK